MLRCIGVCRSPTWSTMSKMLPNSVPAPVAITTPLALPCCTSVPMNAMFSRSLIATSSPWPSSSGGIALAVLRIGCTSPVSVLSSISRLDACATRTSAGTRSPDENVTTSPGTSSAANTLRDSPSRSTWHLGGTSWLSASRLFSERYSCTMPTVMTISSAMVIVTASSTWPTMTLTAALPSSSRFSGSCSWLSHLVYIGGFSLPVSSLRPYSLRASAAWASDSPRSSDGVSSASSVSSTLMRMNRTDALRLSRSLDRYGAA